MRHDFSPGVLKEGKVLFEKGMCQGAHIITYSNKQIVIEAKVTGNFQDDHACSVEIDRVESELTYSTCDCSQGVDCHHLACLLFYLEENFHALLLTFLGKVKASPSKAEITLADKHLGEMERRLQARAKKEREKQLIADYSKTGSWFSSSSLFRLPEEAIDSGELLILVGPWNSYQSRLTEIQLAVRLTGRPKPVLIQQPRPFLLSLQRLEPLILGSQRVVLSDSSFGEKSVQVVDFLRRECEYYERADKVTRAAYLPQASVFSLISLVSTCVNQKDERLSVYLGSFDKQISFSLKGIRPSFAVELIQDEERRAVVKPYFDFPAGRLSLHDVKLVVASPPGVLLNDVYYPFEQPFSFRHAVDLEQLDHFIIPEPLFSSFLVYGLPCLERFGTVDLPPGFENLKSVSHLVDPKAVCYVDLRDGELSANVLFKYGEVVLPEVRRDHSLKQIMALSKDSATTPRHLTKEMLLSQELIWGLTPDEKEARYTTRSEKRIVDFVSETLPTMEESVEWHLSDSMKKCFLFEDSSILLFFSEASSIGTVKCKLSIEGPLSGLPISNVVEAARLKRSYIETGDSEPGIFGKKIIVLPQEEIEALSLLIEDFSIPSLKEQEWTVPLWSIVGIEEGKTISRQVNVSCSKPIKELQQMLSDPKVGNPVPIVPRLDTLLRAYQRDGVQWLRRLREFGLGGILADDMGLGKTVQAICALSEVHCKRGKTSPSLIVCPTSLVDNWKEEINRFEPNLKVVTFVGAPGERRKILAKSGDVHVFVTSYGLIQRDLELFEDLPFSYVILDEAQAIKNRETRNARSVKRLKADHRLVMTGTPVENSVDDLWSLFDFLMPGFLGTHDRFSQSYLRGAKDNERPMEMLKKKAAPFVLRRMKQDVLDDLPPISHFIYHCHLRDEQQALYQSAAKRAQEELCDLVEREGFDRARLHILTTLTRLKQICCHPSLILKDEKKEVHSAKYEMLQDLMDMLIESGHKTVLFSQYTKMLGIIKDDLTQKGIPHLYLDGSTKNRLSIVKKFNEDKDIPLFLVSLRAGGSGLNLVGADSVIHYDMWWNPAVENQATDRVWRMGQKTKVSSYKLITKGTIEEKIIELQDRKKDLISDLVESDDDMLSKLTWEDVLGLLKT
jgi:superfamily II DNA or RNA helicase